MSGVANPNKYIIQKSSGKIPGEPKPLPGRSLSRRRGAFDDYGRAWMAEVWVGQDMSQERQERSKDLKNIFDVIPEPNKYFWHLLMVDLAHARGPRGSSVALGSILGGSW